MHLLLFRYRPCVYTHYYLRQVYSYVRQVYYYQYFLRQVLFRYRPCVYMYYYLRQVCSGSIWGIREPRRFLRQFEISCNTVLSVLALLAQKNKY